MDSSWIFVVCFAAIAFAFAGGALVLRDLFATSKQAGPGGGVVLGRMPLARDERVPTGVIDRLDYRFSRLVLETGIDSTAWAALLMLFCSGLALGGAILLATNNELGGGIGFSIGMLLPIPYLMFRRSRHLKTLRSQLPDVLDLLARAVRAGESLDQAIELVGQKAPEPLAREFRRCSRQLQMGLSLQATMRAFAFRVRLMEARIFATTLSVHRQTGGNLAETLDRMSRVVRERINYRRQLGATTAAGRFSAIFVSLAGVLLFFFMFVFQSEYTQRLLTSPLGQSLLMIAVMLELVGLLWISRLLKSDL